MVAARRVHLVIAVWREVFGESLVFFRARFEAIYYGGLVNRCQVAAA